MNNNNKKTRPPQVVLAIIPMLSRAEFCVSCISKRGANVLRFLLTPAHECKPSPTGPHTSIIAAGIIMYHVPSAFLMGSFQFSGQNLECSR